MTYVEWLRVRNLLRITAIIFAACLVLALILRISFARYMDADQMVKHMTVDPQTQVTHTTLPDGTPRTILDNPKTGSHVVIDDHGYNGKHIVVTEPAGKHSKTDHVAVGSVHVDEQRSGDTRTTTIDTNGTTDVSIYAGIGAVVALIFATILGAPFAREADGHLELALTKPVSRERFALGVMGVDAIGILASFVFAIVVAIIIQAFFQVPTFAFNSSSLAAYGFGIILPLSWYALLTAATASLKRGYGAVQGFAWPVSGVVTFLALAKLGDTPIGQTVHWVFWVISRINPLSYAQFKGSVHVNGADMAAQASYGDRLVILVVLMIVYGALAVFQWRRVEA